LQVPQNFHLLVSKLTDDNLRKTVLLLLVTVQTVFSVYYIVLHG